MYNIITRERYLSRVSNYTICGGVSRVPRLAAATEIRPSFELYFADAAGSEVKFDEHGDGLARYEILNFRKGTNNNGANGYHYRVRLITEGALIIVTRPLYHPPMHN